MNFLPRGYVRKVTIRIEGDSVEEKEMNEAIDKQRNKRIGLAAGFEGINWWMSE